MLRRMKRPSHLVTRFLLTLLAAVFLVGTASAYEDYQFKFSVSGPKSWMVLPNASVPGTFRFGWTSPEWARPGALNTFGASIVVFIKPSDGLSAKEILGQNVAVIEGKTALKPDPRVKLRVLKQSLFSLGGYQGFSMDVVGNGTGFMIGIPQNPAPNVKLPYKIVPTRQRWYCVVKGDNQIVLLSTCPDSLYAKYSAAFTATEASLKVR